MEPAEHRRQLTGFKVSAPGAATVLAPVERGPKIAPGGDSIIDAVLTLDPTASGPARGTATVGYAYLLTDALGCEVGAFGFGSQGLIATGAGGVLAFGVTWDQL